MIRDTYSIFPQITCKYCWIALYIEKCKIILIVLFDPVLILSLQILRIKYLDLFNENKSIYI